MRARKHKYEKLGCDIILCGRLSNKIQQTLKIFPQNKCFLAVRLKKYSQIFHTVDAREQFVARVIRVWSAGGQNIASTKKAQLLRVYWEYEQYGTPGKYVPAVPRHEILGSIGNIRSTEPRDTESTRSTYCSQFIFSIYCQCAVRTRVVFTESNLLNSPSCDRLWVFRAEQWAWELSTRCADGRSIRHTPSILGILRVFRYYCEYSQYEHYQRWHTGSICTTRSTKPRYTWSTTVSIHSNSTSESQISASPKLSAE